MSAFKIYVNEKARAGTDFFRQYGEDYPDKIKARTVARRELAGCEWIITEERIWTTSRDDGPKAARAKAYQERYRAAVKEKRP